MSLSHVKVTVKANHLTISSWKPYFVGVMHRTYTQLINIILLPLAFHLNFNGVLLTSSRLPFIRPSTRLSLQQSCKEPLDHTEPIFCSEYNNGLKRTEDVAYSYGVLALACINPWV